jgi:hypothetical protein
MFLWTMMLPLPVIENTRPILSVEVTLSGESAPYGWLSRWCGFPAAARRCP